MKNNKKKLAAAIALISAGGQTYAQAQEIQLRVELEQIEGADYRASVYYRPSTGVGTTGIGVRLHFNSNLLTYTGSTLSVTNDNIATQQLADTSNNDSVASTDQVFTAAWTSLGGSWPSATVNAEVLLFTSDFELNDTSSPNDILLNLTTSSLPAGYSLASTNYSERLPDIYVAPEGADKSIDLFEDASHSLTLSDFGFSDPNDSPANAFAAVKLSTLPATGSLTLNGASVTVGQEVAVADIPILVFTPAANQHGAPYSTFTFQVKDDGATSKVGSIDLDPTPNTITFNVATVNDAPVGTSNAASVLEDTIHTFSAGDFGFTDPSDDPANALSSVLFSSLPATGTLKLNGVDVTVGQEVVADQLATLTYVPSANASGNALASFGFRVRDNGGTANSGVDTDTVARTMTLNVTEINDAPSGQDRGISILEGGAYTFSADSFGFSDASDSPSDALSAVVIESIPAVGTLTLSGADVTAGQVVPAGQISNLVYTPGVAPGADISNLSFRVRDSGDTQNGGQNESGASNTLTFSVTDINSAPSGADNTLSVYENAALMFAAADFGFSDATDVPANNLQAVIISSVPANGSLTLSGTAVTVGQSIAAADISSLTFTPASDENGVGYSSFTFRVQDDGGTEEGGVDSDPTARTITINVQPVNSAPSSEDKAIDIAEDSNHTFNTEDFALNDNKDNPANVLTAVRIESIPGTGTLTLNSTAVSAGDLVSALDIGSLEFTPAAGQHGSAYASFTFKVQDNGGTANGGVDFSSSVNTVTINVSSVNDGPLAQDNTLTLNENTSRAFTEADFGFSDPNDNPANTLAAVIVETLPAAGALTLNDVAVTAGQEVTAANLGSLEFTPTAHANGSAYSSFTFRVKDNGSSAETGDVNTSGIANTITFDVTPVNSAPSGAEASRTMFESATYTFEAADFQLTDANDNPANTLAGVRITSLPARGELKLNDVAVTAGLVVAAADIVDLTYKPVEHGNGEDYASLTFQVQDNGGTANGGQNLDQTPKTFAFDITPINSAPSGANGSITSEINGSFSFSAANFGFSDINDSPANALQEIVIDSVPPEDRGELTLNDVAVTAGQVIAAADISNLVFTPPESANAQPYTSFTFRVRDNGGTANEGKDTDQTAKTMTINVGFPPSEEEEPVNEDSPSEEVTDAADDINDQLESIVIVEGQEIDEETVNKVNDAINDSNELAEQVTSSELPQGAAGVNTALTALDTLSKTLTVTGNVAQNGGNIENDVAVNSLQNVANVMNALATRSADITAEQRATVQTLTSNTVASSSNLIRDTSSREDLVNVVAATSAVINAAASAGGELSQELVTQAEQLVTKAVKAGIKSFASGIDVEDPAQLANLLATNQEALEFAVEASIAVQSRVKATDGEITQELTNRGLDSSASESLKTVLAQVNNPDGINLGDSTATQVLLNALVQFLSGATQTLQDQNGRLVMALSSSEISLEVEPVTGTVTISVPGEKYSASIVNTRIVSSSVPEGFSFMRDGRALIVANGVAMELAPMAADLVGFTAAVQREGFSMSLKDGGALDIAISDTERFVGVFAYDNLIDSAGTCGAISITAPSGAVNSPLYAFGTTCTNGITQRIVPYVQDGAFFRAVADAGLTMSTDRNTGVITIPGVGRYKPGFFVSALTSSDQSYYEANKNARGVAFKFVDLTGDGVNNDVLFYTATGVQAIYLATD